MHDAIHQTLNHLFRQESGKMIAVLTKLLGLQNLQAAQDLTQDTLLQALQAWRLKGLPDNPRAWLYKVAKNKAVDFLRREKVYRQTSSAQAYLLKSEFALHAAVSHLFEEEEIGDSQLRMIFACCHPSIPVDSQIALALKTLCGLSVAEIAKAFLKDEETIAKRIYRAKEKIKTEQIALDLPSAAQLPQRLDAVLHCLYLLFNEGYHSSQPEQLIREDLCEEAIRLAYLLTQTPSTNRPRTNALLALFCFQASRLKTRLDEGGNIILLKHQDRSQWYRPLIQKGFFFLEAATQTELSVYHVEAAIAYLHAVAPSFEATDWKAIYYLYGILAAQHCTAFVLLNKAIAASYAIGPETALKELEAIKGLENYYLYHTALGEMYVEMHQLSIARQYYQKALSLTTSLAEQQLLLGKIKGCGDDSLPFSLS